jgi:hypothetical protein
MMENERFRSRIAELERELLEHSDYETGLANLYVASYQLHATLEVREVLKVVVEVLLNLVGARTVAAYVIERESSTLRPVAWSGLPASEVPIPKLGEGPIGAVCGLGAPLLDAVAAQAARAAGRADLGRPAVVQPLRLDGDVVGALVVWDYLVQKPALTDADRELLDLLAAHVGPALATAALAARDGGSRSLDYRAIKELL